MWLHKRETSNFTCLLRAIFLHAFSFFFLLMMICGRLIKITNMGRRYVICIIKCHNCFRDGRVKGHGSGNIER